MLKKYDFISGSDCNDHCNSEVVEDVDGEYYLVSEVDAILNSLQQLKAEILPLVERGIVATDAKCIGTANYLFREIQAKLSAV